LIEQMGGEIGVDSTPEEGSEFWITLSLPKARDDAEDLPRPPLLGRRAAALEHHDLARQALQHQLEDCGLLVSGFDNLDSLLASVAEARHSAQPFELAILGVSTQTLPPERLDQRIWELERLACKTLLLCPTTEQSLYHSLLPDAYSQLQAKPACTRKLQRGLAELVSPRQSRSENQHSAPSRPPLILCVDDNPANLLLVQTLLDDMGAHVSIANSGYEAVEKAAEQTFDLIFMDVQMPGMDGRQATEAIRQQENERNQGPVPIVALTAHALANEKRALLQSGLDDYLTKPISERQLAQVVLKWTGLALRNQSSEHTGISATHNNLSVLDADEGLRLAAGKADLAADMLSMLLAGLPGDRQAIRQARDSGERNSLIERVHRLHGATRYCGVPQLRAACQRSETLLKQNDPAAQHALDELDAAIERLARHAQVSA
ncbi:MAG: response regulator, partial [Gammaproteobacteria bacterium]|nr:response regulator [Gammaproteobacteria bacterium]